MCHLHSEFFLGNLQATVYLQKEIQKFILEHCQKAFCDRNTAERASVKCLCQTGSSGHALRSEGDQVTVKRKGLNAA